MTIEQIRVSPTPEQRSAPEVVRSEAGIFSGNLSSLGELGRSQEVFTVMGDAALAHLELPEGYPQAERISFNVDNGVFAGELTLSGRTPLPIVYQTILGRIRESGTIAPQDVLPLKLLYHGLYGAYQAEAHVPVPSRDSSAVTLLGESVNRFGTVLAVNEDCRRTVAFDKEEYRQTQLAVLGVREGAALQAFVRGVPLEQILTDINPDPDTWEALRILRQNTRKRDEMFQESQNTVETEVTARIRLKELHKAEIDLTRWALEQMVAGRTFSEIHPTLASRLDGQAIDRVETVWGVAMKLRTPMEGTVAERDAAVNDALEQGKREGARVLEAQVQTALGNAAALSLESAELNTRDIPPELAYLKKMAGDLFAAGAQSRQREINKLDGARREAIKRGTEMVGQLRQELASAKAEQGLPVTYTIIEARDLIGQMNAGIERLGSECLVRFKMTPDVLAEYLKTLPLGQGTNISELILEIKNDDQRFYLDARGSISTTKSVGKVTLPLGTSGFQAALHVGERGILQVKSPEFQFATVHGGHKDEIEGGLVHLDQLLRSYIGSNTHPGLEPSGFDVGEHEIYLNFRLNPQ